MKCMLVASWLSIREVGATADAGGMYNSRVMWQMNRCFRGSAVSPCMMTSMLTARLLATLLGDSQQSVT